MALRAVPEHPKFAGLKSRLGLTKFQTLGLLEALWHFTGRFASRGNVGKFTDDEIEAWLDWQGTPGAAVEALTQSGWLDVSREYRLIVHDWHQHADSATKLAVKRSGKDFVTTVSQQCGDKVEECRTSLGLPVPEPVPVPEPEAESDGPTVEEIVCAHPLAVTRKLTEIQVTPSHASAVVDALAAGETRVALLAKTQAIARVVLAEWPPGERKFLKSIDRFFRESEFNKPLEEWRYERSVGNGVPAGNGAISGYLASVDPASRREASEAIDRDIQALFGKPRKT